MGKHQSISAQSQRQRLLERLRNGPCTTFEIRHELDILGVGPRIFELRHFHRLNIISSWVEDQNPGGGRHRVAQYALLPGRWQGGEK